MPLRRQLHSSDSAAVEREVRRASLLGLPCELRLLIYEYVATLDAAYIIQDLEAGIRMEARARLSLVRRRSTATVPWLDILLTCKTIAAEFGDLLKYQERATGEGDIENTYVIDLYLVSALPRFSRILWTRLPCPPSEAMILDINIKIKGSTPELAMWRDGEPEPRALELYQMLNHLLHCGPALLSNKPLKQPMHFQQLNIMIWHDSFRQKIVFRDLACLFRSMIERGLISGMINEISIVDYASYDRRQSTVPRMPYTGVPKSWKQRGFYWGVEHGGSLLRTPAGCLMIAAGLAAVASLMILFGEAAHDTIGIRHRATRIAAHQNKFV